MWGRGNLKKAEKEWIWDGNFSSRRKVRRKKKRKEKKNNLIFAIKFTLPLLIRNLISELKNVPDLELIFVANGEKQCGLGM